MSRITHALKEGLRKVLPVGIFSAIRWGWWYSTFYFGRQVRAVIITERPVVRGEGDLVSEVGAVNVARPTDLCRIMTRNGSDKGAGWHTYTTVYAPLLARKADEPVRIFELGIGTGTPGIAASMGTHSFPGASLRGWRDWFRNAEVYGADIDRTVLFAETRIQTFYCDQLDAETIRSMWAQPALQAPFDVMIDDGLHTYEGNACFLVNSLGRVRRGGLYIVEDILSTALHHWHAYILKHREERPQDEIVLAQLPSPINNYDNNLLIIRKGDH